jgi:Xaa-Pro aminopeptidase
VSVPHIKQFHNRRVCLARAMGTAVAVIPTASEQLRNADTHFPYRWDSHFHYLSGFPEPDAVLVIVASARKAPRSILFCRPKDAEREIWDGFRVGPRAAPQHFGVDEAYSIEKLDSMMPKLLANCPALYTVLGSDSKSESTHTARVLGWVSAVRAQMRSGITAPAQINDVRVLINEMRLVKDASELKLMKQAAAISVSAHKRAMRATVANRYEFEIEAELLHEFRRHGATGPAYPSIVAGGANACVLHYVENADRLKAGDLLLIDAGCEWQGYASDITRTYPVSGKFSAAQRALYDVVWAAQNAALRVIKPGAYFSAYHEAALRVLARGLIDLKCCRGTVDAVLESGSYREFYMHRTGHWLGRDVHDVGDYTVAGHSRRLQPGMVVTVEPGLYIRPSSKAPKQFHNIGIRLEDDVVVTKTGHTVITAGAPRSADDIEAWMAGA